MNISVRENGMEVTGWGKWVFLAKVYFLGFMFGLFVVVDIVALVKVPLIGVLLMVMTQGVIIWLYFRLVMNPRGGPHKIEIRYN